MILGKRASLFSGALLAALALTAPAHGQNALQGAGAAARFGCWNPTRPFSKPRTRRKIFPAR